MSDLLDDIAGLSEVRPQPGVNGQPVATTCKTCGTALPVKGEPGYHSMRQYCVECGPPTKAGPKRKRTKLRAGDDEPPASVTNNVTVNIPRPRTPKLTGDAAAVEDGAAQMLNMIPLLWSLTGDEVCPSELQKAIPAIAKQLGVLTKYHPGLKKIFAPGESTGEAFAWIGLLITVSPVLLTILTHHHLLGESMAERLASFVAVGAVIAAEADAPGEPSEPAP